MMIYFKWRVSSFADSLKSLYSFIPPKQPHITNADKNLATWGRIQGDERWWWSASNEECHLLLTHWNHFIPSSPKSTPCHQCGQKPGHLRSPSTRRKMMMMIYFNVIFCSLTQNPLSRHTGKQPHITNADKHLATWGRIQSDERWWWWSTSNEECHLLLTHWNHIIPSSPKSTPRHQCGQKPSHLRLHSRRRKIMMIYFKWRVSSFADSLKSLYPFITEINPTSPMRTKTLPPEVAFKATKDDDHDDLLQMKSVIFCWLTEITLSLHPPNQPHITNADKNLATWGRIQGDERWWWSTSNEECHLLLTHWNHFIPSSPESNPTSLIWTKT